MKQELNEYFPPKKPGVRRLLISHNDLFGIQMGVAVSTLGFKPTDLADIADLTVNGHLHNGQWIIKDKVLNLGNLTGKDFGEDASIYKHNVLVFDTDTWSYEFIKNPYAFNFYKLEINSEADFKKLENLEDNAVLSIKCKANLVQAVREAISALKNIIETRIVITHDILTDSSEVNIADLTVDHYVKFAECCREKLENTPVLEAELNEILK